MSCSAISIRVALAGGTVPIDAELARARDRPSRSRRRSARRPASRRRTASIAVANADDDARGEGRLDLSRPRSARLRAVRLRRQRRRASPATSRASWRCREVIVPPAAGVFSAVGLLLADVRAVAVRAPSCVAVDAPRLPTLRRRCDALEAQLLRQLGACARARDASRGAPTCAMRGQAFELPVGFDARRARGRARRDALARALRREHERTYGHVSATGISRRIREPARRRHGRRAEACGRRPRRPAHARRRRRCGACLFRRAARLRSTRRSSTAAISTGAARRARSSSRNTRARRSCRRMRARGSTTSATSCIDACAAWSSIMRTAIDPILLEVLRNAFETIADEMALILMRTAHSRDRARLDGLLDRALRRARARRWRRA